MIRLYLQDSKKDAIILIETLLQEFLKKIQSSPLPMPGYTHWQKAMPTDTSTWLASFSDAIQDQKYFLETCDRALDQSPLGSAAGF